MTALDRWRWLDAIPARSRTPDQQREWERLDALRAQQLRRLPVQIDRARARIASYQARLAALQARA